MNASQSKLAVISDIAANVFAVFILVLIILLDLSRGHMLAGQAASSPATIEATRDLRLVERAPLRAGDMIELLRRDRNDGAPIVDLFESRIEVTVPPGRSRIVLDARREGARAMLDRLDGLIRSQAAKSARLYVFSNRWYAQVAEHLGRGGIAWRELSVPLALRAPSGARAGDAWSGPYLDLVARTLDRDRFRPALARLLGGHAGGGDGLGRSFGAPFSGSAAGTPGAARDSLLDRVKRGLGLLAFGLAMVVACGSVVLIERRFPRSIRLAKQAR